MEVIVIHETDHQDNESSVIGVVDSVERATLLITEYYGYYKEVSYIDIRDSNIEYVKVLEVLDHLNEPYKVTLKLEWFRINKV